MSTISLTAKYRPQRFADVAGQDAVKRILSRAAAEDRIAPAYLFSGTRGVGKTTLARVLAKALNCETAPTGEPCNVCSQCRQITAGVSPDVIEIDAATHGKVDDARRLKEDVGYAPLNSRYKVFIIDEAHMLTTAAFNALLKTLEEPPGRVTFILATTEPHKFPATIISRCQHYLFKRLAQSELEAHLSSVLTREAVPYEAKAVSLIARRGAGSVRDSMSLLAQVLALGGAELTEADARGVLGLAGQEVFFGLIEAIRAEDGPVVVELLRQVLDKGLDIGFFLRELASMWRNLFLLRQAGERALPVVDLPAEEAGEWLVWSGRIEAAHIHACWQMTLEGQRRVQTSLEPALALELLLLNMAYLPRLLPLQNLASCAAPAASGPGGSGGSGVPSGRPGGQGGGSAPRQPQGPRSGGYRPQPLADQVTPYGQPEIGSGRDQGGYGRPAAGPGDAPPTQSAAPRGYPPQAAPPTSRPEAPTAYAASGPANGSAPSAQAPTAVPAAAGYSPSGAVQAPSFAAPGQAPGPTDHGAAPRPPQAAPAGPRTWDGFLRQAGRGSDMVALKHAQGAFSPDPAPGELVISCANAFHRGRLAHPDKLRQLTEAAEAYFGPGVTVRLTEGEAASDRMSPHDLRDYVDNHPEVRQAVTAFDAEIIERKPR
ncbi:DNA polymerase III subunit gamma/tau [Solidesulfovibrio carbinolicus]|uniref:DNA polymerase III subunit gamma/tau n=1 Tax=Solidesulfovibrio carbinolicus TaxID=296842 RepID=A0A4P6HKX7_9BACT|nr:DNA polymerase III subunit gamma/tau [Solidesulfovibrio carbinolicus]QAZ67843.1 DNA polymerase III, subunit gamma and tau [Solidesulfovibrio carbinolicus]